MHSFMRRHHGSGSGVAKRTKGLILNDGWRYDVMEWFCDTFLFRGRLRELRLRTINLACIQPGETVLDVGCGTGTLAIEVQQRVDTTGQVFGVDPGAQQIARARSKAAQRNVPIDFQVGAIERLPFPDQMFDAALSTIMMHHLPASLKRQGLAEIARVLKPGGRLVIADFERKQEREGHAARFHAGGSDLHELTALVSDAGFTHVEVDEMQPPRSSAFPGVGFVKAYNNASLPMTNTMQTVFAASDVSKENLPGDHDSGHSKKTRPLVLVAVALMIVVAVSLHIAAAFWVSQENFSLNHPVSYILIGLLSVIALFKLTHVLRFIHRKKQ